ncbi:MAG: cation transporter [Saprospiraceae bacterium]|nr:cation transporter [Saprospiraceae bacterium]
MKLIKVLVLNFLVFGAIYAQTPVQMKVDGMSCDFCVNSVSKKLSTAKEIENLKVDLEKGIVTFDVKKGSKVDKKKYVSLVEKAGYDAREVKVGDEIKSSVKATAKGVSYAPVGNVVKVFKVAGNCDMCKKKIENAAHSVKGVKSANWNADTQELTVKYNENKTDLMAIHKKIAAAGYDTELVRADDATYKELHSCCQYERMEQKQ